MTNKKTQSGFVLVTVLWVLVIMLMALTAFTAWVDNAREQASSRQELINAKIKSHSLFSRALFTYMTGKQAASGISWPAEGGATVVIPGNINIADFFDVPTLLPNSVEAGFMQMNGRVIDAGGGLRIMIQDRGGLIGLSFLRKASVYSGINSIGGGNYTVDELKHTLQDYHDKNSFRLAKGAEGQQYKQAGLPAPANGYLRNPLQLRSVMHWHTLLGEVSDAWILQNFKVEGGAAVNVNSAQIDSLSLVVGSDDVAQQIENKRQLGAINSIFHIPLPPEDFENNFFTMMPADGLRFWSWHINHPTAQVYDVQFNALAPGQSAWVVNWMTRVTLPDELARRTAVEINHPFFH
ncbi:MAG: hypothetical protein ACJA0N_000058 [Pseudohongiellaceae bacterium]|jgi:hypothetical protein